MGDGKKKGGRPRVYACGATWLSLPVPTPVAARLIGEASERDGVVYEKKHLRGLLIEALKVARPDLPWPAEEAPAPGAAGPRSAG